MVAAPGPKGPTLYLTLCAVTWLSVEIKYLLRRGECLIGSSLPSLVGVLLASARLCAAPPSSDTQEEKKLQAGKCWPGKGASHFSPAAGVQSHGALHSQPATSCCALTTGILLDT